MRMLIGLGAAALAAVAMPAVAHAAPHTTVYVLNHQLVIEAEPGKTNNIVIGMESASHRLTVTDSGDLLAVGAGCSLSGDIVRCNYESGTTKLITSVRVNAGDLNDRINVTYDNTNADAMPAYVYGEAGNDVIETRAKGTISGGDGTDTLRPKRGGVSVYGGAGTDRADYNSGSALHPNSGVSVTIGSGTDDGYDTLALKDYVASDVENLTGTNFVDHLVGSAAVNNILALGANDLIWGLAGNDTLNGGLGVDTCLDAADGDVLVSCP
ncbi:calcium-binding protein [Lentzea terrae]|uniref:calcium-binding protein n=1 Tax=Lentzea terrae TaxID=2200761 RepID=UPI0013003FAC|nr:calcium-binding protein [Lentzea terrae]